MHPQFWPIFPLMILGLVFASKVMTTWIRAKHGYPLESRRGCSSPSPDEVAGSVKHALATRDETIAKLEERVRVLERIVTDDSRRVASEIEALR
jgi:hypothetical protein